MREGIESIVQRLRDLRVPEHVINNNVLAVERWRKSHPPTIRRLRQREEMLKGWTLEGIELPSRLLRSAASRLLSVPARSGGKLRIAESVVSRDGEPARRSRWRDRR